MLRLEQIHRQAADNPIIRLSKVIRETGRLNGEYEGAVTFKNRRAIDDVLDDTMASIDKLAHGIICWMNKTRVRLNGVARKRAGWYGAPQAGEPVMCLKNYPPVYNGMRGILAADTSPGAKPWHLHARIGFPDEGVPDKDYTLCSAQINREKTFGSVDELHERGINESSMGAAGSLFDLGYAMTCHKAQGSQFKTVVLYLDRSANPHDEEYRKWLYTAATRASDRLVVLT